MQIIRLFILVTTFVGTKSNLESMESDITVTQAVLGRNASIPCHIQFAPRDKPIITLWYIDSNDMPFYSYDQRTEKHSSWVDKSVMGSRATFMARNVPPSLILTNVTIKDGKTYKCRVDYKNSHSRITKIRLNVIVPPSNIEIRVLRTPVNIGQKGDVICKVYGGNPRPHVFWQQGSKIVDNSFRHHNGFTENRLDMPAKRKDLTEELLCFSNNNDISKPLTEKLKRNVTCGPSSVTIEGNTRYLKEHKTKKFICTVIGSNPPAQVSWYQENIRLNDNVKVISDINITKTSLVLNVTRDYHLNKLVCRAQNTLAVSQVLEDSITLNVSYKPSVSLSLGRSLDPYDLKEGNDLFFECNVNANPSVQKIEWLHEDRPIVHNVSAGILVSDKSLALQRVERNKSGRYQCKASNQEGETLSNPVYIKVQYSPRCTVPPSLRGVALEELTNITCKVDADPSNSTFKWTFNNSMRKDTSEIVPDNKFTQEHLRSTILYTPHTERDYGTLLCYATNVIGTQREPCSFTVISAGPPEPVASCSYENITSESVEVACIKGFDGGLPQQFLIEVHEITSGDLMYNSTSNIARFVINGLEPGTEYYASVTAFNTKGRSPRNLLEFNTRQAIAMHKKTLPTTIESFPVVWVLGIIGGVILVVVALLIIVHLTRKRSQDKSPSGVTTIVLQEQNPDLLNLDSEDEWGLGNIRITKDSLESKLVQSKVHIHNEHTYHSLSQDPSEYLHDESGSRSMKKPYITRQLNT